ncbi:MAG: diguanylate cyclase [Methylophaga sp.]|nr:diguanylate cyclase [Methylophaga sp.]
MQSLTRQYSQALVIVLFTITTGFGTSYLLYDKAKALAKQQLEAEFEIEFRELKAGVVNKVSAYQQVLRAAQGLFEASENVTRDEFRVFVSKLKLDQFYPGIQGVGLSKIVSAERMQDHLEAIRVEGFPHYAILPEGERDIYTSIVYLEPFTGKNISALGFDMYSEARRRDAMQTARDSGEPVISGRVKLFQDTADALDAEQITESGILMYLPLYDIPVEERYSVSERRESLRGWVYAVFRVNDLLRGELDRYNGMMKLRIFDGEEVNSNELMYGQPTRLDRAVYSVQRTMDVAGRKWLFKADSMPEFEAKLDLRIANRNASAAVIVTLLFATLFGFISVSRTNVIKQAREITEAFNQSQERLKLANDAAQIGISDWLIGSDSVFWDEGMYALYELKSLRNIITVKEWQSLIHRDDRQRVLAELRTVIANPMQSRFILQFQINTPSRQIKMLRLVGEIHRQTEHSARLIAVSYDITDEWHHQVQLAETEARWRHALEGVGDGVWDWSIPEHHVTFSAPLAQMLGYTTQEFSQNPDDWTARVHPDDRPQVLRSISAMLSNAQPNYHSVHRQLCKDGLWKWILVRGVVVEWNNKGKAIRAVGTQTDMTQQKNLELALLQSEAQFRDAFETAPIGMALVGLQGEWIDVNHALCRILGYSESELLQRTFLELTHPDDLGLDFEQVHRLISGEIRHYQMEKRYLTKSGEVIYALLSVSLVRNNEGQPVHFVSQIEDISARKQEEERMKTLAFYDPLTGLPNRRLFEERLRYNFIRSERDKQSFALMFLDLDRFKVINDTHGHDVGDEVIKYAASQMLTGLRASDTLSRFGGDEFVVLLSEIKDAKAALKVAQQLVRLVAQPFSLGDLQFNLTMSVGVAMYEPSAEDDIQSLMKKADTALYQVKSAGRNGVVLFDGPGVQSGS